MKFAEYQERTKDTAQFPRPKNDKGEDITGLPVYQTLGLVGEVSEMCEKLDEMVINPSPKILEELAKEAGDCLWYLSEICSEIGIKMEQIFETIEIVEYKQFHWRAWQLMKGVAKVAELTKKAWRNDKHLTPGKREKLTALLSATANHFKHFAKGIGLDIEAVMQANIDKLKSRLDRGKICGEGDNR